MFLDYFDMLMKKNLKKIKKKINIFLSKKYFKSSLLL